MTIARFRHLAEAYGADIARWPAAERAVAAALLSTSDEARRALEQARALDSWLALAAPAVDDAQAERIFDAIGERIDNEAAPLLGGAVIPFRRTPSRTFWPAAAFLAGMAVMGVLAGTENLLQPASTQADGLASLVAPQSYLLAWNE
ncbi:hypothetical protein [Azospirillum sp. sgz302134]